MGAPFAQWLGRPSTICFLRRLLATTGDSTVACGLPRQCKQRRDVYTATKLFHPLRESVDENEDEDHNRRQAGVRKVEGLLVRKYESDPTGLAVETALQMSFNSGVSLLDDSIPPEKAYKALWLQANVASRRRLGQLVVDRPEHRENMKLWIELFEHRQRVDGFAGVEEVWKGMRYRNVDLPLLGPEADILWTTLLHACITTSYSAAHGKLLDGVMDHAKDLHKRCGATWPGLYKCVIGRLLRIQPLAAPAWHKNLINWFEFSSVPLADLAGDCLAALDAYRARRAFISIQRRTGQKGVYDRVMPEIVKHTDDGTAVRWHRSFLRTGDGPSDEVFALPAIQRVFELDDDKSLPMVQLRSNTDLSASNKTSIQLPPFTRANMSALVGEVHGIKPKEISDTFVAKMFATRAFTLDLVVKGLAFFGVDSLGPLALHEMALKAESPVEFCNRLSELKSMGISTNTSLYGCLLRRVAIEGPAHLFRVLLASDQHPEAYGDASTQESLLASFLDQKDMANAHLTLIALSLAGHVEHTRAWNRVLQHYIMQSDYVSIEKTMRHMRNSKMPPTKRTLAFISRNILPSRTPGKTPQKTPREAALLRPLQFTTNAYKVAAEHGLYVKPTQWKEVIRRYAMEFRWFECEHLVWWLASWYGKDVNARDAQGRRRHWLGSQMLATIFPPIMQEALVHWGFRYAGHRNLLRKGALSAKDFSAVRQDACEPWARGLFLALRLRKFGIPISRRSVRRALIFRLLSLFGPSYSTKRINEEARRFNKLTLADYIAHAHQVCNTNLFKVDPALLSDVPPNPSHLMVWIFGARRRISKKRKEYADMAAYARNLEKGYPHELLSARTISQKRRLWDCSRFRLVRSLSRPTRVSSAGRNPRSRQLRRSRSAH